MDPTQFQTLLAQLNVNLTPQAIAELMRMYVPLMSPSQTGIVNAAIRSLEAQRITIASTSVDSSSTMGAGTVGTGASGGPERRGIGTGLGNDEQGAAGAGDGSSPDADPRGVKTQEAKKAEVQKPKEGDPKPAWAPHSIMGMALANSVVDVQKGLEKDKANIPQGVYTASNDPLKANVVSHTLADGTKQNVYLRDTAANIQEDVARKLAVNAINPDSVKKAAAEGGVAKGTKIKLRTGEWIEA